MNKYTWKLLEDIGNYLKTIAGLEEKLKLTETDFNNLSTKSNDYYQEGIKEFAGEVNKILDKKIKEILKHIPYYCRESCGLTYRHCSGFCDSGDYMFSLENTRRIELLEELKNNIKKLLEEKAIFQF